MDGCIVNDTDHIVFLCCIIFNAMTVELAIYAQNKNKTENILVLVSFVRFVNLLWFSQYVTIVLWFVRLNWWMDRVTDR